MPARRPPRSPRQLYLALAALALGLLASELVLRGLHAGLRWRLRQRAATTDLCTRRAEDPRLVYELVPGRCGANRWGFLDRDHPDAAPAGGLRIAVIGDSVAQGQGVAAGDRFAQQLERRLAGGRWPTVEVPVFALSGYGTGQELVLLDRALALDPDLVVWSYVLNDPAHPVYHNANGALGRYWARPPSYLATLAVLTWVRARELVLAGADRHDFHRRLHRVYRQRIESDLQQIGRRTRAASVAALFVIHPVAPPGGDWAAYPYSDLHAHLTSAARSAGLEVVDLLAPFRAAAARGGDALYADPWHPTAAGHALVAATLAERIQRGHR